MKTTPDAYLIIRELSSPYLRLCPVTISTSIGLSARLSRTPGRDWLSARPDVTARSSHINGDPNRKERLRPALHPCRASFHPQHSAPNGPPIMGNPRVFFDITIDGDNAGRIIMEVRRTHHNHHHQHQAAVDLAPVTQRYFSPICVNLATKKRKKERRGGEKKNLYLPPLSHRTRSTSWHLLVHLLFFFYCYFWIPEHSTVIMLWWQRPAARRNKL